MSYRVLCAYDGSAAADKAFDFAVNLAKRFDGELHVLAVVQPPEPAEDIETEALLESGSRTIQQALRTATSAGEGSRHQWELRPGFLA